MTPDVAIASAKFQREAERIRWRRELMARPGGTQRLVELGRKVGWREQDLGPWLDRKEIDP